MVTAERNGYDPNFMHTITGGKPHHPVEDI